MAIQRPKHIEIVMTSRQVDVLMWQGTARIDAFGQINVTEQTHYSGSAGGKEKRPVDSFSAKQIRWNGYGSTQDTVAAIELEPVKQTILGIVYRAKKRAHPVCSF